MFGVHIPSISDVKNAVTGAASTALHTTEDLGSSAVSHAASLGRSGLDLGRTAVDAVSHADVQKLGSAAVGSIGEAERWAESGIQTGVLKAGQGVHAAAEFARSHIPSDDPLSKAARGLITAGETYTRFDIGAVGGVGKAAVGLVGSVGQLGVMAAEYQVSPGARAAINGKIVGGVEGAAKSVAGYADGVAHDPARVFGDAAHAAGAVGSWAKGEVKSAEQAIKDGHGPESFGMQVGDAATYLIPVGGEVRAVGEVGEVATRGLAREMTEDGARTLAQAGGEVSAKGGVGTARELTGLGDLAERTGSSEARLQKVLDTAPGSRPDPTSYVSSQRIAENRSAFDDGASRFALKSSVDKYGLGQRDGTTFVMTHAAADNLLAAADHDPRALEQALGLPTGQLDGSALVRIDFEPSAMDDLHVRMPSGNEAGANEHWLPGGFLPSGLEEAVLDGATANPDQYVISTVK